MTTHRHKFRSTMNSNRRRWGCGVLYSVRNNYGRPQCPSSTAGSFCTTRFLPFPRLSVVMGVGGWLFPSISRGTVAYRQGGGFLSTPEIPFYSIPTLGTPPVLLRWNGRGCLQEWCRSWILTTVAVRLIAIEKTTTNPFRAVELPLAYKDPIPTLIILFVFVFLFFLDEGYVRNKIWKTIDQLPQRP